MSKTIARRPGNVGILGVEEQEGCLMYSLLAQATAVLHFITLLYIGLGGFLAWRWPGSIIAHIPFAAWGFAVIAFDLNCPLTWRRGPLPPRPRSRTAARRIQ